MIIDINKHDFFLDNYSYWGGGGEGERIFMMGF